MAGFRTVKGFRDFFPEECAMRNYILDTWRRVARRYGFMEYEGPVLESTDLFRKKSGDEITGQPGGDALARPHGHGTAA